MDLVVLFLLWCLGYQGNLVNQQDLFLLDHLLDLGILGFQIHLLVQVVQRDQLDQRALVHQVYQRCLGCLVLLSVQSLHVVQILLFHLEGQ